LAYNLLKNEDKEEITSTLAMDLLRIRNKKNIENALTSTMEIVGSVTEIGNEIS
jgi:hypothetical protein